MSTLIWSLTSIGLLFLAELTLTVVMLEYPSGHENVTHVLGGGRTRGGKSQFERAAVLYLARRYPPGVVRLVLSDVKRVTFGCFDGLPHLVAPVAKDAYATLQLLEYLVAEQELRYQQFERFGVEKVAQYNQMFPAAPMTRIACLIDECFDLLFDPNCKEQIELMLMKLRPRRRGRRGYISCYLHNAPTRT